MEPPLNTEPNAQQSRFHDTSRLRATLHRYQLLLRKHWWVIPLAISIVLLPASLMKTTGTTAYESKARMWVAGKLNISEGKLFSEEMANFMGTQVELLKSTTVREHALAALLKEHPQWDLSYIGLEVSPTPSSAIFNLRAVGSDGSVVRAFLNAVMDEYLKFKKDVRTNTVDSTLVSLMVQAKHLAEELKQQRAELDAFTATNNVIFLQQQGDSDGAHLATINKDLRQKQSEYRLLQALNWDAQSEKPPLAKAGDRNPTSLDGTSTNAANFTSVGSQTYLQIQSLKDKRAELSQFLYPIHPKIVDLDKQIADNERTMRSLQQQGQAEVELRRQTLQQQIANLEAEFKELEPKAMETAHKVNEYERRSQQLKTTQALYDRLTSVSQSVDVSKNFDQEPVAIMEKATMPRAIIPARPKHIQYGLAGGFLLGILVLYLLDRFDDRFSSIAEMRDHLQGIVIGQIPEITLKESKGRLQLITAHDERHVFVESFRNIRSSLLFMFNEPRRPKTILVTSSVPEEGKSTVTANLAVSMALAGSRVLLIDGDLRRANQHKIFGVNGERGLAEILEQKMNYTDTILPTGVANLSFIPAGNASGNPGELFLSPSTDVFIREIYPQYDFILIDSPPVLATDDTSSLAPKLDGVIFVVRGSFTSARMARESVDLLAQRHVNVMGFIFNRAVTTAAEYYYYYRYNNYYQRPRKTAASLVAVKNPVPHNGQSEVEPRIKAANDA